MPGFAAWRSAGTWFGAVKKRGNDDCLRTERTELPSRKGLIPNLASRDLERAPIKANSETTEVEVRLYSSGLLVQECIEGTVVSVRG
jgi:hypothetical protein